MLLPSGDQRGFVPFQPDGKQRCRWLPHLIEIRARLGRGRACSGLLAKAALASHRVARVASPSTVETVYTTQSPLGEICASPTFGDPQDIGRRHRAVLLCCGRRS